MLISPSYTRYDHISQIRDQFVGKIQEERNRHNLKQVSYCGIADVVENLGKPELTEDEIKDGFSEPKWVFLEDAAKLFEADRPATYLGTHMHARDQAFLKRAIQILAR